jgi:hypothetical protein
MTKNKIIRDTLFIDMKYIILYRKLGYNEIEPDIFVYNYDDITIKIESEQQLFHFHNQQYPLKEYKHFVLLECIDRLLKKGYFASDLLLNHKEFDIRVLHNNQTILNILVAGWDDYQKLISAYHHQTDEIVVLYTSQLSGGLVDYISTIYTNKEIFHNGLFEKDAKIYDLHLIRDDSSRTYPSEFEVRNDIVKKYIGHEKIVRIPDGIKRIDTGVFWNALYLEEVILPDSVTCIAGDSFIYCQNLKKINIPKGVDQIGDNPFAGTDNLQIENFSPNFIIDEDVLFDKEKKILIHYFPQSPRTEYLVPESVEWIGKHSFYNCKALELVTITKSVKFMGNNVFSDCPKIVLKNESPYFVYENGGLYNKEKTDFFHYSMGLNNNTFALAQGVRKIGRNSFWNCRKLVKIIIPSSVREIGYNPFAYCINLEFENHSDKFSLENGLLLDYEKKQLICCTSKVAQHVVQLPATLINIGRNSFTGCESLVELSIPDGVQQISRGAFSGCINLERIQIPKSVKKIEAWAFSGCIKLKQIQISKNITIATTAINDCDAEVLYYD